MKTIVDTCVWSMALRRSTSADPATIELQNLIEESRVKMIGPIRQELLAGISSSTQFTKLKMHLRSFPDVPLVTEVYELAAEYFNICRSKGIQGSTIDFTICAAASFYKFSIFTLDKDFLNYARFLPLTLHSPT